MKGNKEKCVRERYRDTVYDNREISCFPKGNGDEEMTARCRERGVDDRFQVNRPTAMPGHGLAAAKIKKTLQVRDNIEGEKATEMGRTKFLFSHPLKTSARPSPQNLHIAPLLTATPPMQCPNVCPRSKLLKLTEEQTKQLCLGLKIATDTFHF